MHSDYTAATSPLFSLSLARLPLRWEGSEEADLFSCCLLLQDLCKGCAVQAVRGGGSEERSRSCRVVVCYGMLRVLYVYYCRTYEKAVSWGEREGKRRACAKGHNWPRPVRSSLATSH